MVTQLITKLSSIRVYFPKDLRSLDSRMSVLKTVQETKKRFADGLPLLDPIEDMGIKDKGLKETIKAGCCECEMKQCFSKSSLHWTKEAQWIDADQKSANRESFTTAENHIPQVLLLFAENRGI